MRMMLTTATALPVAGGEQGQDLGVVCQVEAARRSSLPDAVLLSLQPWIWCPHEYEIYTLKPISRFMAAVCWGTSVVAQFLHPLLSNKRKVILVLDSKLLAILCLDLSTHPVAPRMSSALSKGFASDCAPISCILCLGNLVPPGGYASAMLERC